MRLFHFEVIETLLLAGIPISKIDILRPLLKKYGHRITASSHMKDLISFVLTKEKEKIKVELGNMKQASIIFDATAQLGETLAIIVHFKPTQRLICLKGNELAQRICLVLLLITVLGRTWCLLRCEMVLQLMGLH